MSSAAAQRQGIDEAFQDTTVEAFLSGLYTALLLITLVGFYKRADGKRDIWMVSVTLVMYILSTIHFGFHWYLGRHAFVRNDQSPKSIFMAFYQLPFWGRVLGSLTFALNTLIADCLFIWRCWVLWNKDWRIVVIPVLTTVVGTVFSGLNLAVQEVNASFTITGRFVDTGTTYLSLSLATTLYVTIFISYRIWRVSSGNTVLDKSYRKTYSSIIEAVVESALLYSISLLIMVVLIVRQNVLYRYLQDIVAQIVGIAPTLILARLSFGFSNSNDTRRGRNVEESAIVFSSGAVLPHSSLTLGQGEHTREGGETEIKMDGSNGSGISRSLSEGSHIEPIGS